MKLHKSKILSTGVYHPKKVVTNIDLEKTIDTSDAWIYERTGIKQRHICSTEGGEFPTDMAFHAAQDALKAAELVPNDIDFIFFASTTPDYKLPNSASILQVKLGITNQCGCVDLAAACSGFVYGINMANAMIQSGMIKKALVVGSEMLSREVDWTDRSICILFGDGCGAAIVGANEDDDSSEILSTVTTAEGRGRDFFFQVPGGAVEPITPDNVNSPDRFMQMAGREMFKVAVRTLADNALMAIEKANLTIDDIDWVIPHQANIRILEATAKRLNVPLEKMIINIDKYANTSAATVPMALHDGILDGRIKRGQILLFDAFGAGLTSGATILKF